MIESIQGSKSTRAQNLRAVHTKKKFEASIEQERTHRQEQRLLSQEKNEQRFNQTQHNRSYLAADDSIMVDDQEFDHNQSTKRSPRDTFGEPSFMNTSRTVAMPSTQQKVRQRDRRGVYQSIEVKRERSPAQQEAHELRVAEERLRTIEMISKFREDKIKAEFKKLEQDLHNHKSKASQERKHDTRAKAQMDR